MKTKNILLLILFIGIHTNLIAQQPFQMIDEVYGYLIGGEASDIEYARFDDRYNASFLPAKYYSNSDLTKFKGKK